jgi:hypothetical protein
MCVDVLQVVLDKLMSEVVEVREKLVELTDLEQKATKDAETIRNGSERMLKKVEMLRIEEESFVKTISQVSWKFR